MQDGQEAISFGRRLRRKSLEAFVWRYPSVDAGEYVRCREVFDSYVYEPPASLEGVGAIIDLFEYNVEEDPSWPTSPLKIVIRELRFGCERLQVP